MVNLYAISVIGDDYYSRYQEYVYHGTASSAAVASRAALKLAKKDGLVNRQIKSIEFISEKEFGR